MFGVFGLEVAGEIWGDARAALGIINRNGQGKSRHIQTGLLWVQQGVAEKGLTYGNVLGKVDPADVYTISSDIATIEQHVANLKRGPTEGRAPEAIRSFDLSMSFYECNRVWFWRKLGWVDRLAAPGVRPELSSCTVLRRVLACHGCWGTGWPCTRGGDICGKA